MKYQFRPREVEAFQLPERGDFYLKPFHEWAERVGFTSFESSRDETMIIHTPHGEMYAGPGDFIVQSVEGGYFFPLSPQLFYKCYEEIP